MTDYQIASLITLTILLIVIGPRALRRNRGRVLPTAAIWLAALVLLAYLYETFWAG